MGSIKSLTSGRVAKYEKDSIRIGELAEYIGLKNGSPLLIIGTRSKFLRVIPLLEEEVILIRIRFFLEGFTEGAREVFNTIKEKSIGLIHSTGVCPLADSCVWEGYFSVHERDKIEEFIKWLHSLAAVDTLESEYLKL